MAAMTRRVVPRVTLGAMRTAAVTLVAVALVLATQAGARPVATPKHYTFSFKVASKPDYLRAFPKVKVTGSGKGSFSIKNRQIDRDGTVFWDLTGARGSLSLSTGGHVIIRAKIVGGRFGTDKLSGGLGRHVLLNLRITSSTRFRCATPAALLGMQDVPLVTKGNKEGMQFHACTSDLQWTGKAPALVVKITPA
jgi:hypothetical protein